MEVTDPTLEEREARRLKMAELHDQGVSYRAIGRMQSPPISGTRVKQLIDRGGTKPWGRSKRQEAADGDGNGG